MMNHKEGSGSTRNGGGGGGSGRGNNNNYGVSELLRLATVSSSANSIYYGSPSQHLPPLPYSLFSSSSSSPSPSDPDYLISILETVLDIVNQDLIETENDDKSHPSLQGEDEDDEMLDQ